MLSRMLTAADGHALETYRSDPQGTPRGAIVVIQEIFGVNHHIRAVTDGFAQVGYVAIAPAMYDRLERGVVMDDYTSVNVMRGRGYKAKVSADAAMLDVAAAVAAVASAGRVGIVGY